MQTVLIIVDGAGLADPKHPGNAVTSTTLPTWFGAMNAHGYATLEASGPAVGLDETQTGNSEVGHLTIGAGFVVPSTLARIEAAYKDGSWAADPLWTRLAEFHRLHVVGLLSDAGTHGHGANLERAAKLARAAGIKHIIIHPVLDGVDSQAGSAPQLLKQLLNAISDTGDVRLGLVIGRATFCDRSGNLDVSRKYCEALIPNHDLPSFTQAALAAHVAAAAESSFPPHRHQPVDFPFAGEPVLLTQNRADRARQVAKVIGESNPVYSLVELGDAVPASHVFFPVRPLDRGLPFELKSHGLTSVRIAETCKFPHVTFFLNGLNDGLEGEAICVPSVPEAEIASHPEMSAEAIADAVVNALSRPDASLIVVNIANLDQVGHLGSYPLAVAAAGHVEAALQRIRAAAASAGATVIMTSDHGNADRVVDDAGRPFGSHTERPVPFTLLPPEGRQVVWQHKSGSIAQIAPTVLATLGITPPAYMAESLARLN
jgi:2,3-bisphosphoglycerate-independent phosphoglycerate mutase